MSIVINSDDPNNLSKFFQLENEWLIGKRILFDEQSNDLFNFNDDYHLDQVEQIHTLSQQIIEKPNRICLSSWNEDKDDSKPKQKKVLRRLIPSQNLLFELAQHTPENRQWTFTIPYQEFQERPIDDEDEDDDDVGFQSASSSLSEDKFKSALVPVDQLDHWSHALIQAENKYFTWEQRGSYLYDRTRPYLFDYPLNDRSFQHLCLLLLIHQPSSVDIDYHPIAIEEFLRDLCYMLMSISSRTFQWNETNQTFELQSNIYVLGYTRIAIERFSLKYIQAGNEFYSIKQYINQSSSQSETENEFCQALRCYLRYVQKAIAIHHSGKCSLVKFAAQIDPILSTLDLPLSLITTIKDLEQTIRTSSPTTSVPFVKLSSILHTLLNSTYHTIDPNYFLLLVHFLTYSLRPLLMFLTNLIISSNHLDRYNEYPILFNYNRLIGLKTNEFWSKTFTIRYLHSNNTDTIFHQILPIDYLQQIVNITRSLMLIKLCDKNHPLCSIAGQRKPELKFHHLNTRENLETYEREMKDRILEYEQAQKQRRLDIEQAKVQERMDMYARQDQQRAERQKILADEQERILNEKITLRNQWQQQADERQRQIKAEKEAEAIAAAEMNKPTTMKTIIGSRLATPYADLVDSVRKEIISEYDAKMRDAGQREEQFRKRIQPNNNNNETESPTEIPPAASTTSSPSFHTPTVEQSPSVILPVEERPPVIVSPPVLEPIKPAGTSAHVMIAPETTQVKIRQTATEETTQAEYRPGIKLVQSNVLKSTIQNYLRDHHSQDENPDEEELPEKVYDWDSIISNGPQFKYEDTFDFQIQEKTQRFSKQSWFDSDLSPARVWLEHSIAPLIRVQSQLVNRALLNYFFDELKLLSHFNHLRAFYFLATGHFGLAFCGELSRILLSNDDVRVIYHVNSMRQILYTALDQAGELNQFIDILHLTSKTNIPNSISLLDPNLLDYFDLNYTIQWPLNIVISAEMLEKYRIIFRFLLRILIVKQVLNEIWVMLKSCKQQNSTLAQLHQYRHQMQHFMTVFTNYISNQVIQIAWNELMREVQNAKHINEITAAHHAYLDRTMLNCLLTPNAAPILNEVNRVLTLIIRFRCQLKTFSWILTANYTDASDASVQALRTTFEKYHIAVLSLFKVLSKLVEKGYKTSLADLLIRLNHNGYYDRIATSSSSRRP